jgi:hypothetical protein
MALIPFPNVPFAPGVPLIPRSKSLPPTTGFVLRTLVTAILRSFQSGVQWGIFTQTGAALADTTLFGATNELLTILGIQKLSTTSVGYVKDSKVSDFPVEQGGFASYNKVQMPSTAEVVMSFSGNDSERAAFLASIDAAQKSTNLFSVVTPDARYINHVIERYSYERTQNEGAYHIIVKINLKEVRQVTSSFALIENPKSPNASPQQNGGKVQAIGASDAATSRRAQGVF